MKAKDAWQLTKETFSEWIEDKAPRKSAALAYYTIFSIAPILIIAIAIASLVFGKEAAQGQINEQIRGILGQTGAKAIEEMLAHNQSQGTGIFATLIGLGVLLFGATGVFAELHDSMNNIWEVKPKPSSGIMSTIKERFLSFTMVLGVGFLLLVSLAVSAALAAFGSYLSGIMPGMTVIAHALNLVVSFGVVTLLFAMIYKVLPDAEISWRDVWIGAAGTAVLFVIGKFLIGLYLGQSSVSSSYGAAGALVIVLLWVYYAAQILFLGAEFTQVYARRYGSRIVGAGEETFPQTASKPAVQQRAGQRREQPAAETLPWRERETAPGSGNLWSLLIGLLLGFFYAMRRKRSL